MNDKPPTSLASKLQSTQPLYSPTKAARDWAQQRGRAGDAMLIEAWVTGWNARCIPEEPGALADHLRSMLLDGTVQCPLCGKTGPHPHSPDEIVIYRNGMKYGRQLSGDSPSPSETSELQTERDTYCFVLGNLVRKLEAVHADERYKAVWTSFMIYGGRYTEPTYTEEFEAAQKILRHFSGEPPSSEKASAQSGIADVRPLDIEQARRDVAGVVAEERQSEKWPNK